MVKRSKTNNSHLFILILGFLALVFIYYVIAQSKRGNLRFTPKASDEDSQYSESSYTANDTGKLYWQENGLQN